MKSTAMGRESSLYVRESIHSLDAAAWAERGSSLLGDVECESLTILGYVTAASTIHQAHHLIESASVKGWWHTDVRC
jgi:hypothetical protein